MLVLSLESESSTAMKVTFISIVMSNTKSHNEWVLVSSGTPRTFPIGKRERSPGVLITVASYL